VAHVHAPAREPPIVERRPVASAMVHLSAANAAPSPVRVGTSSTTTRATLLPAAISVSTPVSIQCARVSKPTDPAEMEATKTARKIAQMSEPPARPPPVKPEEEGKKKKEVVQRAQALPGPLPALAGPVVQQGGSPLPSGVRSFMEPRFGADFGNVRIHTGEAAAKQSASLNAHAFTVGEHIFFGRNQFQPESAGGRELIAHELTHTIQQGAAVQRSADMTVTERAELQVQRLGVSDVLNWFADKANYLPGFRLLTIVLGLNPINMAPVDRSAANILRGLLELIPVTGALIAQALDSYGIFAKVGAWVEGQIRALGMVGGALKAALTKFLDSLSWSDIFTPGDVWERAKRIFTEPIDRLIAFGKSLAGEILGFIREAILLPLAKLAEGTRGYDLLKAVIGQDPVTGQPVPRTPETLIGGFLKLIGQEDIWQNMQKANAIPRAWAWFQGAMAGLMGFVSQIPGLFIAALKSLEISDLILPLKAFGKLVAVFGNFVVQFINWGLNAAWKLLEIIFDVVSPGALLYIRKTGAALKSIFKNPLPFVGNLVKAAKRGFLNFADNFLTHLKAGLIDWLTGSLPGIYIPKAFSLVEIAKFAFSVLGLTWENIRGKLVKAIGEPAVKVLETTFDIVVTLVRDGPAAAWDKIKEQLANLKDMVIGAITDFVVDTVVKKAIPKLISMFIPGAGFISAILSIYDTVMVFVNKISQIIQVVTGFIDSIVAIAAGQIDAAAARVEKILANLLSLAINFLAGFVGLGKVADKVLGVIQKIRQPIDKALDWLIGWIVIMAKKLGKMVVQAGVPKDPKERVQRGLEMAEAAARKLGKGLTKPLLQPILAGIQLRYGLTRLEATVRSGTWWVVAAASPEVWRNLGIREVDTKGDAAKPSDLKPMPAHVVAPAFQCNVNKYVPTVYAEQLKGQERGLNKISVVDWLKNRANYERLAGPQEEARAAYRQDLAARIPKLSDAQIEDEMSRLAALHEPDLVAGGFNVISKLGSRYINSSIGSQWKTRAATLETHVKATIKEADRPNFRMNVTLTSTPFTPPK